MRSNRGTTATAVADSPRAGIRSPGRSALPPWTNLGSGDTVGVACQPLLRFARSESGWHGDSAKRPRVHPAPIACRYVGPMARLKTSLAVIVAALALSGCGADGSNEFDPTPTKLDGTESHEFEQEDLDAAAGASDAVKDYCAEAVSEAQRLGCESHVTDAEIP
jgi:predicted small lipoprotein YifL